jgi:peptidoglycan-associated lipoprotein
MQQLKEVFMLKKLSLITILSLLISCQSKNQKSDNLAQDSQPMVVEEEQYQTIDSESQAEAFNETNQVLQGSNSNVETVEVQDRIFFGYNSSDIAAGASEILDVQTQWLLDNPKISITIEGHCDTRGTREYNIALGEKRANAAKNYLVKKGIDSSRIKTISFGKERPAYFGTSEEVHQKNRRAVTVVN